MNLVVLYYCVFAVIAWSSSTKYFTVFYNVQWLQNCLQCCCNNKEKLIIFPLKELIQNITRYYNHFTVFLLLEK